MSTLLKNDLEECNCQNIRELCNDLIDEAFQRFKLCPILTLPNIAIDFNKTKESIEAFLEVLKTGTYIIWKNIGKCTPKELDKTMSLINDAEMRFNEETNRYMLTNEVYNHATSEKSDENFLFIQKIATVFMFHAKALRVGRMTRNCPVTLHQGKLTVITLDKRYQYCSTNEIIFVTNLDNFKRKLNPGTIIQLGKIVKLKVMKRIDEHFTCCIIVGGIVKSYTEAYVRNCNPITLPCLSYSDIQNCESALKYNVTAVVLPHPHTSYYVNQIRKYFCENDKNCRIKILVEFDEDVFLCNDSCRQNVIIESVDASHGIFLAKPLLAVANEIASIVQNKIVIANYQAEIPSEYYSDVNSLLPTCFLLTYNLNGSFTLQFKSFASMINSLYRRCDVKENESAKSFISISSSGIKAIEVSCLSKNLPIIAISDNLLTTRELHLYKGVKPLFYDWKILKNQSNMSVIKHLLRLSVGYAKSLCLLFEKYCIKQPDVKESNSESSDISNCSSFYNFT